MGAKNATPPHHPCLFCLLLQCSPDVCSMPSHCLEQGRQADSGSTKEDLMQLLCCRSSAASTCCCEAACRLDGPLRGLGLLAVNCSDRRWGATHNTARTVC